MVSDLEAVIHPNLLWAKKIRSHKGLLDITTNMKKG